MQSCSLMGFSDHPSWVTICFPCLCLGLWLEARLFARLPSLIAHNFWAAFAVAELPGTAGLATNHEPRQETNLFHSFNPLYFRLNYPVFSPPFELSIEAPTSCCHGIMKNLIALRRFCSEKVASIALVSTLWYRDDFSIFQYFVSRWSRW